MEGGLLTFLLTYRLLNNYKTIHPDLLYSQHILVLYPKKDEFL